MSLNSMINILNLSIVNSLFLYLSLASFNLNNLIHYFIDLFFIFNFATIEFTFLRHFLDFDLINQKLFKEILNLYYCHHQF